MWTDTQPIFIFSFIFIFYLLIFNLNNEVMKKTYQIPAMQAEEVQPVSMIATSLPKSTTTVDGNTALVKGGTDWDIFGEYTVEEEE